jgi:hypothetical protein
VGEDADVAMNVGDANTSPGSSCRGFEENESDFAPEKLALCMEHDAEAVAAKLLHHTRVKAALWTKSGGVTAAAVGGDGGGVGGCNGSPEIRHKVRSRLEAAVEHSTRRSAAAVSWTELGAAKLEVRTFYILYRWW